MKKYNMLFHHFFFYLRGRYTEFQFSRTATVTIIYFITEFVEFFFFRNLYCCDQLVLFKLRVVN